MLLIMVISFRKADKSATQASRHLLQADEMPANHMIHITMKVGSLSKGMQEVHRILRCRGT